MKAQPTKVELALTYDQTGDIVLASLRQHLKYCEATLNWHGNTHILGKEASENIQHFKFMIEYYGGSLPETAGLV